MTDMENENIAKLQKMIDDSEKIVFFGGAGVSTASGIPDFRSSDGIYNQKYPYPPETILSHSFYEKEPEWFYKFYREKMICPDAKPNAAHLKLAEMEEKGKLLAVITQNIDGLHTAAGSKCVLELHGSVHRNYCRKCGKLYDAHWIMSFSNIPECQCGGRVKPDVVLYEEALDNKTVERSVRAIAAADMLIIGGTSLAVYPAAGLIQYFTGKYLVVLNRDTTGADSSASLCIHEPIAEVLSKIKV